MAKSWPKDKTQVLDYEEVITPVVEAFKYAYTFERQNKGKNIPYIGYEREGVLHCCAGVDETFSKTMIEYAEKEWGRDLLDTMIGIVFHLGMEQGRRELRFELSRLVKFGVPADKLLDTL